MSDIEEGIVVVESTVPSLFGTSDPGAVIDRATAVAKALKDVIDKQHLTTKIGKGEHLRVEGWTLLGAMLGVFPATIWTKPIEGGYMARVEARRGGELVGAAEAVCLRSEARWKTAEDFAILGMAQTRATSRALRQALDFVVRLAGYDTTPAEEMVSEKQGRAEQKKASEVPAIDIAKNLRTELGKVAEAEAIPPAVVSRLLVEWFGEGKTSKDLDPTQLRAAKKSLELYGSNLRAVLSVGGDALGLSEEDVLLVAADIAKMPDALPSLYDLDSKLMADLVIELKTRTAEGAK